MARYSRRTGPTIDLALTGGYADIPGLPFTRYFDQGELLILFAARYRNTTGAAATLDIRIQVDNLNPDHGRSVITVPTGQTIQPTNFLLHPITEGPHRISVIALANATAGNTIIANTCSLTVIQLPLWDADTDIL